MTNPLFDPRKEYPSEGRLGEYLDLEGRVLFDPKQEEVCLCTLFRMSVETSKGVFDVHLSHPVEKDSLVTLRIYRREGHWSVDRRRLVEYPKTIDPAPPTWWERL